MTLLYLSQFIFTNEAQKSTHLTPSRSSILQELGRLREAVPRGENPEAQEKLERKRDEALQKVGVTPLSERNRIQSGLVYHCGLDFLRIR